MNIGFGITASYCTHQQILKPLQQLVDSGYNVYPIVTENVLKYDTRFGSAEEFLKIVKNITKNEVVTNVVEAEPFGPKNLIDVLVIAPCTGNTLAKLANAITDNAVTMTAKSLMRNNKPVVIGVATNDGLGLNMCNIAKLLNTQNFYFVPFKQDDPVNKPKSVIADWSKIEDTVIKALKKEQIQPLLLS